MSAPLRANPPGPPIDYDELVTEDQIPADRILVEKQFRLLTRPLYASWPGPGPRRPFLVLADVGWFYEQRSPPLAPDVLLSLDVSCPEDLNVKQGHSYYQWLFGKPPDVVIEIVSDRTGGEEGFKKDLYARLGLLYYAVYDPCHCLSDDVLRVYRRSSRKYKQVDAGPWLEIGLGLRSWEGTFEKHANTWLRWCDADGEIIPTGEERALQAEERIRELEAELRRVKRQRKRGEQ